MLGGGMTSNWLTVDRFLPVTGILIPVPRLSHHPPLSAQDPFASPQRQDQQKDGRHVPKVLDFWGADPALRICNVTGQPVEVLGLPISSARLRSKLLEQLAVLFGMEIFGHSVKPLETQLVAS